MTRSLARALDNTMYNPEGPAEAMLANIPGAQGLAQQFPEQFGGLAVKPKLDAFGRERKYPNEGFEAMYNVFPSTKPTEDPVELELKRLQTGPEGEPRYDVQPGFVSDRVTAFEQSVKLEPGSAAVVPATVRTTVVRLVADGGGYARVACHERRGEGRGCRQDRQPFA